MFNPNQLTTKSAEAIQSALQLALDQLSLQLIEGQIQEGDQVFVDYKNGQLTVSSKKKLIT